MDKRDTVAASKKAHAQLKEMLEAIERDSSDYFVMGKMRATKTLANRYRVTITIQRMK